MSERTIRSHIACPACDSSDGLTVYDDHEHCYVCDYDKQFSKEDSPQAPEARPVSPMTEIVFDSSSEELTFT